MKFDKLSFIEVTDETCEPDEGNKRVVSLAFNPKKPKTLHLLGGLSHSTEISFDEKNAQDMIDWLRKFILEN